MDNSIYQSLQEAYLEDVYSEGYKKLPARKMVDKIVDRASDRGAGGSLSSGYLDDKRTNKMIGVLGNHNAEKAKAKSKFTKEEVILSHLIDEGYVDDVDSGMVLMSHMSEEWVESILEAHPLIMRHQTLSANVDKLRDANKKATAQGKKPPFKLNKEEPAQMERMRRDEKRPPSRLRSGKLP